MTIKDRLTIRDLGCLFQFDTGDVIHALLEVQSILVVPENDESPVRPFHTSLRDFLTTRARSNELFINPAHRHLSIACDCLAVMAVRSGDAFFEYGGLKFASRSWSYHLICAIRAEGCDNLLFSPHGSFMMNKLIDFVSRSFDPWINSLIAHHTFCSTLLTLHSFR